MKTKINVMFLGSRSGQNDNGDVYYMGQFLDKSSNSTFRLYYKDNDKLRTLQPYKDYELDVEFYINTKGLWAVRGL